MTDEYDYVNCEIDLPDGWKPTQPLLTKDMTNMHLTHVITKDNKLLIEKVVYTLNLDQEINVDMSEGFTFDSFIEKCQDHFTSEKVLEQSDVTGWIHLWGWESPQKWHDYYIRFLNGKLIRITTDGRE